MDDRRHSGVTKTSQSKTCIHPLNKVTTTKKAPWRPTGLPAAKAAWQELASSGGIPGGPGDLDVRYFYRHALGKRHFDAEVDIYGDFRSRVQQLRLLLA